MKSGQPDHNPAKKLQENTAPCHARDELREAL
jgi:hypothetical protein